MSLKSFAGILMTALIIFIVGCNIQAQNNAFGDLPRQGFVGVRVAPVPDEVRGHYKIPVGQGIQATEAIKGGSAEAAGIMSGDIIMKANDTVIENTNQFVTFVRPLRAGNTLQITLLRDGKEMSKTVTIKPRPLETSADFDILYRTVNTADGRRRVIITKPKAAGKFPAVLLVGGIGCYSLDNISPDDSYGKILYGLTRNNYVTMRVEKSGMGDSEGAPCSSPQVDVKVETAGYVAGLRALKTYDYVDAKQTFIFGHSIGGIVGPLVAAEESVKGIIVAETVGTNWLEYELVNYRRQAVLGNAPYDEIERTAQQFRTCKEKVWFENQTPEQVIKDTPACEGLLQAPASYTYMRQLAELNLGDAWRKVDAPALIIYGSSDYVTSTEEHEYLRDMINSFHPGKATYIEIPEMEHSLAKVPTQRDSFNARFQPPATPPQFQERIFTEILGWLKGR